MLKQAASC